MKLSARLRVASVVGAVLALAAGCTSTSADGPTSTAIVSLTVSPSVVGPSTAPPAETTSTSPSPSVIEPSTPSPTSGEISPQEAADRAAIEAQWRTFWEVYVNIVRTPEDQRSASLDAVSVDPIKSRILAAAQRFSSEGIDYYGTVVNNPYWPTPVDGQEFALLRDCMDQSQYGSLFVASGEKRSTGIDHDHVQGGFIRGSDGVWRVQNFQYITDTPC
ncbi:MAG TPA: hypothetical protein VIU87_23410 [Mycobacterium sp.]